MAIMTYGQAINSAHRNLLENNDDFFVMGQGINSPWFVGETTVGLVDDFGTERVIDTPVCEAGTTGMAIGAAMAGMRPCIFHPRMDFMYLALDQIVNHCSNWNYMTNGRVNVPVVIRGIVNRGGEQSTQHSQSPLSLYANIPGLKVVAPASPSDAKGLFIASVEDNNPVIFIDDRWLYDLKEEVSTDYFKEELGKAKITKRGDEVTIVAVSYLVRQANEAAEILEKDGISCEVIDIRTIKPLDEETIVNSCKKTQKVVVACGDWEFSGLTSYIASIIYERCFRDLEKPIKQISFENIHTPASTPIEHAFFKFAPDIVNAVKSLL